MPIGQLGLAVKRELKNVADDIAVSYEQKGMRASGRLERSIQVKLDVQNTRIRAKIIALDYIQYLERGMKASEVVDVINGKTLYERLQEWVVDKGLATEKNEIKRIAYFVKQRIVEKGYDRGGTGGVKLITGVLTKKRKAEIKKSISEQVKKDATIEARSIVLKNLK